MEQIAFINEMAYCDNVECSIQRTAIEIKKNIDPNTDILVSCKILFNGQIGRKCRKTITLPIDRKTKKSLLKKDWRWFSFSQTISITLWYD
jgi:hypothetical protein